MIDKPVIIHVIDSLGIGGAEILYVDLLPELSQRFNIVLVTLNTVNEFSDIDQYLYQKYSLDFKGYFDIIAAVRKFKAIIRKHAPKLIHSHLFWSTIISRLAVHKTIPFYFSVHATLNEDPVIFYKKQVLNFFEKLTYRKHHNMIGVTNVVIDSFKKVHPNHGRTIVLHNFVRDEFFYTGYRNNYKKGQRLKLVVVSNLRLIKNIPYLIETMILLKGENVSLDIYGDGPLRAELEEVIGKNGLTNVTLKGKHHGISEILQEYDALISPSKVEGFGIAVAEAMSIGLPIIVSDIPVYREICADKAIYIDNSKPENLCQIISDILKSKIDLTTISEANKAYAKRFSKQQYVLKLINIYNGKYQQS